MNNSIVDDMRRSIEEKQKLLASLSVYHGSFLLTNIAELGQKDLLAVLGTGYESLTVTQTCQKLLADLSTDSVALQNEKFQAALRNKTITRGAHRLDENKRKELFSDYRLYELLQIALSPKDFYFQLIYKNGDKAYNAKLFSDAIDAMVIDPAKVPQSSLATLGITHLDPDCQNLKNIFKDMHNLKYTVGDETKRTPTINTTKDGQFITFSSQSVFYSVEGIPTQGEKRKEDILTQMAVYPDLLSLVRREGHILEDLQDKKFTYYKVKRSLISMIRQIDWTQDGYGANIVSQVDELIKDINKATSATVIAQKIYHFYKIHGQHRLHDRQHLQAGITGFTKRIHQLMGMRAYVQFHSLELEDQLYDQQSHLETFHSAVKMDIPQPGTLTQVAYDKFLFAFEKYKTYLPSALKQPFLTFTDQIQKSFTSLAKPIYEPWENFASKAAVQIMKADVIVSLQRKFLHAYVMEHQYKEGLLSVEDIAAYAAHPEDADLKLRYPELYEVYFTDLDAARTTFSPDFSYEELTTFFAELKNMNWLQQKIDDFLTYLSHLSHGNIPT